ncbi:S1C family serine protease [Patescibacteria group bacterium]|nr:S1C family serine protease [Patescibacteria group bacterium]
MKEENIKIKSIADKDGVQLSSQGNRKNYRKSKSCLLVLLVIFFGFIAGGLSGLVFDNVLFDYLSRVPWLTESKFLQVKEAQVVIQREEKITTTTDEAVNDLIKNNNAAAVSIIKKSDSSTNQVFVIPQAEGHGLALTADGLIVTSEAAFISQPQQYQVLNSNGETYDIAKVFKDPLGEIAFIKIKADNLAVAELSSNNDLQPGQQLYSIFNNPLGKNEVKAVMLESLEYNPTFPLDSDRIEYYLQGDSANLTLGSALFTIDGKVVGLVVPGRQDDHLIYQAADLEAAFDRVLTEDKISYPSLGFRYLKLNSKLARMNGLSINEGLLIYQPAGRPAIVAGSPAAVASLQAGDIITNVAGEKINGNYVLSRQARKWRQGDEVEIKYLRAGQERTTSLIIKEIKEVK